MLRARTAAAPSGKNEPLALYLASIRTKIATQQSGRPSAERGRVEVRFSVAADGRLGDVVIERSDDDSLEEEALKIAEATGGEAIVLCMGPEQSTETIKKALSMGAASITEIRALLAETELDDAARRCGLVCDMEDDAQARAFLEGEQA